MGSSAPQPPPVPSPQATAAAQTGENVDTAIANAALSHVNQTDQYGDTSTYNQSGTTTFRDPTSGTTYNIPTYSQTTQLSPAEQSIYNTGQQTQQNLANIGKQQSANVENTLNTPVNLQGESLQKLNASQLPNADLSANNINNFINTQWEQPLGVEQGQEMEAFNQNLADQGIPLNSTAYNNAQYNEGQALQGQTDTYANSMYGTAANDILGATSLQDQNILNAAQESNAATSAQQGFNNQVSLANREQPLNEISALQSGSQISTPTFQGTPQTTIPTTDYASIAQNTYQDQLAAYNEQVANTAANNGGLFGLGGAVLGGLTRLTPAGGI